MDVYRTLLSVKRIVQSDYLSFGSSVLC